MAVEGAPAGLISDYFAAGHGSKKDVGILLVHGFTGSHETASQLLRLGMIISLGHRIVPDNSCRIRTMVQNLPDSSFVIETDAPQHDTSINN